MTAANQSTSTNGSESSNPKCGGEGAGESELFYVLLRDNLERLGYYANRKKATDAASDMGFVGATVYTRHEAQAWAEEMLADQPDSTAAAH